MCKNRCHPYPRGQKCAILLPGRGALIMPINRLTAGTALAPEQVSRLNEAYKRALRALYLVDRNDPVTEIVRRRLSKSVRPASAIRRRFPSLQSKTLESYRPPQLAAPFHCERLATRTP